MLGLGVYTIILIEQSQIVLSRNSRPLNSEFQSSSSISLLLSTPCPVYSPPRKDYPFQDLNLITSFLCSEFSKRFLIHSEYNLKSLPWSPGTLFISPFTLLPFDYLTPSKIASMLFLKLPHVLLCGVLDRLLPLPGISTQFSNFIQVSAPM